MEPKPTATDAPDDALLIEKIVRGKDRDAFAELAKRFEQPAFQLALHITDHRALAEEAVQDALLAVWHGAESFRPGSDLRRWILGVVAHRALRAARMERKSRKAMDYERDRQRTAPAAQGTEECAERGEVLGALRELLARLPDAERKLVALYYGAGMTQEEIGTALNLSQRTVSFKLQACLERLRKNLAQAGLAAAAPLLTPQLLGTVLESGEPAPGLVARTLARCDKPYTPRTSGLHSVRAAAKGRSAVLVIAAVLALAAATYPAWSRALAPGDGEADVPPPEETAPAAELRTWMFRFDKPVSEGFDYLQGDWHQGTYGAQHRTGLIAGTATPYNAFLLPKLDSRLPLKATIRFQRLSATPINVGLGWSDGNQSMGARKWMGKATGILAGRDAELCCYFMPPYTVSAVGDKVGVVCKDAENVERGRMFFTGGNIGVESIEIREVRTEEIPENIRDVEALIRTCTEDFGRIQASNLGEAQARPLAEFLKEQAEKK